MEAHSTPKTSFNQNVYVCSWCIEFDDMGRVLTWWENERAKVKDRVWAEHEG